MVNTIISKVMFFCIPMILSWGFAKILIQNALYFGLVQEPNHRSSHIKPTPSGGGLGIVIASSLVGIYLVVNSVEWFNWGLLFSGFLIAFTGLRDDIVNLPASWRFAIQGLLCLVLILLCETLPGVNIGFGMVLQGWILSVILLFSGVWWLNLFNFMDGIDGIAGAQAIFMLSVVALFALSENANVILDPIWILMVCIAFSTLGFLLLNWAPAKIFMGDVGSLYLAFMIFGVALVSINHHWFTPQVCYSIWLILPAAFVVDATMTLIVRILRGERWYEAHRSHVYQKLLHRFSHFRFQHRAVTLLVIAVNLFWLTPLAYACVLYPNFVGLWVAMAYIPLIAAVAYLGAGRP